MMSRNKLNKTTGEGSGSRNDILLNDIDVISKALYQDNKTTTNPRIISSRFPETKSKSKPNTKDDPFLKDNKKPIWGWNKFKSFNHIRNKRFNCCFTLQVHSLEGLPSSFEKLSLCVKWKRRDGELTTRPAKVLQGVARFEEIMTNSCSVYGSRSGPHHSAKYEAKHFLLYASLVGDPELDLGKHRVDLTRLLPLTLEELESEKSSGKWTTSYRLSGKAKGASMNVSFGYSVVDVVVKSPGKTSGQGQIKRGESLPVNSRSVVKEVHEILPVSKSELSESVSVLYKKLEEEEEEKSIISVDYETQQNVQIVPPEPSNQDLNVFSVIEQGIEYPTKENVKQEKEGALAGFDGSESSTFERDLDVESLPVKESESLKEECVVTESNTKDEEFCDKELLLQELELALNNVVDLKEESDSQEENENIKESGFPYEEKLKTDYKEKGKSLELDYAAEAVADDFLDILGIEHSPFSLTSESEPNSPRERLLRQFEKDSMANGSSLFNFNIDDDNDYNGDVDILRPTPEEPLNKTKASVLEDMETEALMREWGLDKNAFQGSPSNTLSGSGGPVDPSLEESHDLPPLGEGLGPFVQTSNGGFLRSMNPEIFKNAKSGGNLIMQVSSPVVVPAEMGSGIMDVLQRMASVGIEKLSMQANKLMPLEDISGKTMQQIVWESTPALEAPHGQHSLQQEPVVGQVSTSHGSKRYETGEPDQEYVSLEDLAPLAMNKIEALSVEGLRIQSGMSDKEAPSNISPQSIGEISALEGKRVNFDGSLGLEGTGGLQLLDVKNNIDGNGDDIDGIMGLSVTLDEWMRLDAGEIDDGVEFSERTSKILAAHHASDLMRARRGKGSRKGGLLGNNFTVALMVQLRDPLRNFEPVGTPMLALVQVERVFVPPKPKINSSIYSLFNKPEEEEEDEVHEIKVEEKKVLVDEKKACVEETDLVPQFKITEVHVAGVKTEPVPNKKALWGSNAKQQQAGSRWLVANGMGKKNTKHPLMKSKVDDKSSGSLWSISSKGKGKGKVEPPVRNPNVIIPNETVKLLSGAGFV